MMNFNEIHMASKNRLTDELAAACWSSEDDTIEELRRSVGRLLNHYSDLRLYESDSGDLISSEPTDEQASESCLVTSGHMDIDGVRCYVAE